MVGSPDLKSAASDRVYSSDREVRVMVTKALLVRLEAQAGQGDAVEDFLVRARLLVEKEPAPNHAWQCGSTPPRPLKRHPPATYTRCFGHQLASPSSVAMAGTVSVRTTNVSSSRPQPMMKPI